MEPISKIYTDDMVQLPVRYRSVSHYIMMAFYVDTISILVEPFQSKQDIHCLFAYDSIMTRLKKRRHTVDLQILDNEDIQFYGNNIGDNWNFRFQIVSPSFYWRNAAERANQTFKAHFL